MPPWLPIPFFLVQFSGICELTGGLGLLLPFRQVQFVAGWGLVLLLIAVFPANIYMAIAHVKIHGFPPEPWMAWARLLLQPLLIGAVLWTTNLLPGKETSKVS